MRTHFGAEVESALRISALRQTRETDPVVIGTAFTLLRVAGRIDPSGKALLLRAIQRQIERYGERPTLRRLREDVESFEPTVE